MMIAGVLLLRRARNPGIVRVDDKLFKFEKTTELVTTGIFKYIRHPLYSSLIFLTWGIYFKHPDSHHDFSGLALIGPSVVYCKRVTKRSALLISATATGII